MLLFAAGCDESGPLSAEREGLSIENSGTLGGKPSARTEMYAALQPGGVANELTDPDGGGRLGTGWTTGFALEWDDAAGKWVQAGAWGHSDACPAGHRFGLLEGNVKGGKVSSVWLRGDDGVATDWSSDKIDITPQDPDENAEWTLQVRKYIDVSTGKGQSKNVVCTVYVHDIKFTPVN